MGSTNQDSGRRRFCWTCKDRKVRCDGSFPTCINCMRANRKCVRSSVRLSWPNARDGRRLIISNQSFSDFNEPAMQRNRKFIFLNTSHWDVSLQRELGKKGISPVHFRAWSFDMPRNLSQIPETGPDGHFLLSYFERNMANVLVPFGNYSSTFPSLLRMAFIDDTPASSAVLHGILALSSLKLYGDKEASTFKTRAMSLLSASLKEKMDLSEYLRCLGASLLLGSYEISSTADPQVDWTFFICGAIKIAKTMSLPRILGGEESLLLDWLSCHTFLSQFSQSHWLQHDSCVARQPCTADTQLNIVFSLVPDRSRIIGFLGCSLEFLDILSSICAAVLPQTHAEYLSETHKRYLYSLELRLQLIEQHSELDILESQETGRSMGQVAELYKLAGLIYLHRAALRTRSDFPATKNLYHRAFGIIEVLGHCDGLWPLFVIGCEARLDGQRLKILEIFARMQQTRDSRNISSVKKMTEAFWIQDDLCEEEEMDYVSRINALISAHNILPTFV